MIRIDGCGAPPILPRMRRKERALACRRSTAALAAANERRSSAPATRFLGPGRSARSRWFERSCAAQRALPAPSCPSPASFPAGRSWCRPGVYPRSRPGAAVTSRRPREPLSPRQPASPADVLYGSEICEKFVAEMGTNVKFHRIGDMQSPGDYWDRPSLFWGNLAWWPLCSRGHHHKQSFGRHAISAGTKYRVNAGEQSAFQRLKGSPVFTAFL